MATAKKTVKNEAPKVSTVAKAPMVEQATAEAGAPPEKIEDAAMVVPVESVLNGSELDEYRQRYPKGE